MANEISKYPIPVVLKKILEENLTGELIIKSKTFEKSLRFIDGTLVSASSSLRHEQLGGILYLIGKLKEKEYETLEDLTRMNNEKIGEKLVKRKYINQQELFSALLYQVRAIVLSTFSMESGVWNLVEKIPEIPYNTGFPIALRSVLAEGARKIENLAYFRSRNYFQSPMTVDIPQETSKLLTDEELRFYEDLKKCSGISNEEIISKLNLPPSFYWEKIVLFQLLNLLEFKETRINFNKKEDIERLIKLNEMLREKKISDYELFGLYPGAGNDEIDRNYKTLSQTFHPDRYGSASAPEIKKIARYVYDRINKAYNIVSVDKEKKAADSQVKELDITERIESGSPKINASVLYDKAYELHKQSKYRDAALILESAIRMDRSRAKYFHLLGLCQTQIPEMRNEAEKCLKKASKMEPWNADHVYALGELYKTENLTQMSKKCFQMALEINVDHTLAGKAIHEFEDTSSKLRPIFSKLKKKKKK